MNKMSKQSYITASIISLAFFAPNAFAGGDFSPFPKKCAKSTSKTLCLCDPYLGLEVIQTNMNYKEAYGKHLFYKNPVDWSGFVGINFMRNFGVELGYEMMPKKYTRVELGPGGILPGNIVLGANDIDVAEYSIRADHTYAGIFASYNWCRFTFSGFIGGSLSHIKARSAQLADELGAVTQAQYDSSINTYSQTRFIPMLRISAIYNIYKCLGIRMSFLYRNTGAISISPDQGGTAVIKLKDTLGGGIGIIYYPISN